MLKRAALRGLKDLRLDQAILHYMEHGDSYQAAEIAGVGRAEFLWLAMQRGVTLLKGPSHMDKTLEALGQALDDERLIAAGRHLVQTKTAAHPIAEAGD